MEALIKSMSDFRNYSKNNYNSNYIENLAVNNIAKNSEDNLFNISSDNIQIRDFIDYFTQLKIPEQEYLKKIFRPTNKNFEPTKINKSFVHKTKEENILVSTPVKIDNVWYFSMFKKTDEFRFDHESDHIQGMLIMEVARQSSIATTHLEGLNMEGIIT
jgi:hypothetical protein